MKKVLLIISIFLFSFSSSLYAAEVKHIDNEELKDLIEQGAVVIDVRATSEWKKTGVIKDSHLLMFYDEKGNYKLDAWLNDVAQVADKDEPVILICHSGTRSKQLAKYLNKVAGYGQVHNVKRGIVNWIKKDNPVVAPSENTISINKLEVTE